MAESGAKYKPLATLPLSSTARLYHRDVITHVGLLPREVRVIQPRRHTSMFKRFIIYDHAPSRQKAHHCSRPGNDIYQRQLRLLLLTFCSGLS